MQDIIYTMSSKGLGMTCVVDGDDRLAGIITDGDLRRTMAVTPDIRGLTARDVMTARPITIGADTLAVEALALLEQRKITSVVVIGEDRRIQGVLHLHDLWRTEMV
jgi:arabinose-5-phosphate isomerase